MGNACTLVFMTMTTSICTDLSPFLNKVFLRAQRMSDLISGEFGTCGGVVLGTTLHTLAQQRSFVIPEWGGVSGRMCIEYFENDKIVLDIQPKTYQDQDQLNEL